VAKSGGGVDQRQAAPPDRRLAAIAIAAGTTARCTRRDLVSLALSDSAGNAGHLDELQQRANGRNAAARPRRLSSYRGGYSLRLRYRSRSRIGDYPGAADLAQADTAGAVGPRL